MREPRLVAAFAVISSGSKRVMQTPLKDKYTQLRLDFTVKMQ